MSKQMLNKDTAIVYSLKVHSQLQIRGIPYLCQMPNPKNSNYTCWVYEKNEEFIEAFDEIVGGGKDHE